MKSLKRTLCLVLALVMVLGLFGIASATDFTDDNSIQYKEAVDVMTGIGAINGMGDGTFNPKGTITRAQAAKLVTYAVLGKAAADGLTGVSSSFSDVTVAGGFGWAIPSIEFLVKEGVINGMGDGTFNPNGEISSVATLKMLLCALGYGAKGEYTGNGWDFQATLDANKYGLTAGRANTASVSAPATREEVALYCFNTIQKPMVEYVSTLDVYINSNGGLTGGTPDTIMSTVYPTLTVNGSNNAANADYRGKNAFGAPANKWAYKGKDIGAFAATATLTYTTAQTTNALTAALRGFGIHSTNGVAIYENNKLVATASSKNTLPLVVAALQPLTGNGTVVDVYTNDAGQMTTITVVKSDVAKVTSVNTTTGVSMSTQTPETARLEASYTVNPLSDIYSSVAGLKKDDIVLVTPVWNGSDHWDIVASVSVPAQATGKLTDINTVNGANASVTVAGKTYPVAADATANVTGLALNTVANQTDCTVYIDSLGNVVDYKGETPTTNYMAVARVNQTLKDGIIVNMVSGYAPDGTVVTLNIGTASAPSLPTNMGKIYSYLPATAAEVAQYSAEYTLTAVDPVADGGAAANDKVAPANADINSYDVKFVGEDANASPNALTAVPYAPDVKFIYFTTNDGVVVKNGVQNVDIDASGVTSVTGLYTTNAAGTLVVPVVYIVGGSAPNAVGTNFLFLAKLNGSTGSGTNTLYNYTAIIDGVPTSIQTKATSTVADFYAFSKDDATGIYTLGGSAYTGASTANAVGQGAFTSLDAGYILTGGGVSNKNALNAQITDLTQTGLNTLADIAQAKADGKTVMLAVIYDDLSGSPTQGQVKRIYVTLATVAKITITTQPSDTTAANAAGTEDKTFTVVAQSNIPGDTLSYQWQSSTDGTTWANYASGKNSSSTKAELVLPASVTTGTQFHCVVTGTSGATATSNAATITVG